MIAILAPSSTQNTRINLRALFGVDWSLSSRLQIGRDRELCSVGSASDTGIACVSDGAPFRMFGGKGRVVCRPRLSYG